MKKLLYVLILCFACFVCSCHTDKRVRVKPTFDADRTSPEYKEVLYRLWRQRELKRFEKWYEKKYGEKK